MTIMHLDGCHFYVWVWQDSEGTVELSFDEREGENLALHGRFGEEGDDVCVRCVALETGADARHETRSLAEFPPRDAREISRYVIGVVGIIDEEGTSEVRQPWA